MGAIDPMADIDEARRLFAEAGLAFPKAPDRLAARLKKRGDWLFSTRAIKTSPYELDDYVNETPGRDYAVLAHSGHGINSYAIQYYLVQRPLRLFLHLPWGGVYVDAEAVAADIRECFSLADEIVAALPNAGHLLPDTWLTIVGSNFYGSHWAVSDEVHGRNERSAKPSDVLADVLLWLKGTVDGTKGVSVDASRIAIRSASPGDAASWLRLRLALWPDGTEAEHRHEIDRFFAGDAREPKAVLVAEDAAGDVIGVAELSIRPYAEGCHGDRVAYLEGWFVVPEARGHGVGQALIAAAEAWGRSQGCGEFASDAEAGNAVSAAAHRALGFTEVGLVRCFRKDL